MTPRARLTCELSEIVPMFRNIDYEGLRQTLAGLHYLAFAFLMLHHLTDVMQIVQYIL
jgi:hypothetical protein